MSQQTYRLYKRRWLGVAALSILNAVGGMAFSWFGPIATDMTEQFGFSLNQINWLGNVVNLVFLPSAITAPYIYSRLGLRRSGYLACVLFILSAWIRYAGTRTSLSKDGAYTLIVIGQIIAGLAQPVFQVLAPGYSEKWFDLKGRTTATMIMSMANPVGNALSQLFSPIPSSTRTSILIMAIMYTAVTPVILLVENAPPSPPTYAGGQKSPPFMSLVRAMLGKEPKSEPTYMTIRQRIDLVVVMLEFGCLAGLINAFSILSNEVMNPVGYDDTESGLFGAALVLSGLVAAAITAPLFDHVMTHHLAISAKVLCPITAAAWLGLIWAIKPDNPGAIFALMAIIGACSLTLLPVALELAVEVTRNADGSAALLWFTNNLVAFVCVIVESALRASPNANPPLNMKNAYIFQGAFACACVTLIFLVEGKQIRRQHDVDVLRHGQHVMGDENNMQTIVPIDRTSGPSAASMNEEGAEDMKMDVVSAPVMKE